MPKVPDASLKHLVIKKYPNRRYYDATHSRHLNLPEIRSLVQQGYDLRVTDAKTGTDITAQVLTQIILELETPKLDWFPVALLVRVIRMNDQLVKDFIEKYFNQALQSFLDYQRQVEEQIRRAHGLPPAFPSISASKEATRAPFADALSGEPTPSGDPAGHILPAEEHLKSRIRELEADLQKAPPTKQPAKRLHRRRQG